MLMYFTFFEDLEEILKAKHSKHAYIDKHENKRIPPIALGNHRGHLLRCLKKNVMLFMVRNWEIFNDSRKSCEVSYDQNKLLQTATKKIKFQAILLIKDTRDFPSVFTYFK
jgi:hypothetical protein